MRNQEPLVLLIEIVVGTDVDTNTNMPADTALTAQATETLTSGDTTADTTGATAKGAI